MIMFLFDYPYPTVRRTVVALEQSLTETNIWTEISGNTIFLDAIGLSMQEIQNSSI